jgi:transposase
MPRPSALPAQDKIRIVLAILAGEVTVVEAARRWKVSETSIGNWKRPFLDAGSAAVANGAAGGPNATERALAAQVEDVTSALGEAHVELGVWKKSAEGRLGPSRTSR